MVILKDIESRKLVKHGGSLYVCIPSTWTSKNKLNQGDTVHIGTQSGRLLIFPGVKDD